MRRATILKQESTNNSFKDFQAAMESEKTSISISPTSFSQFPNIQSRSSKTEVLEKWLQSYEKTPQWQPSGRSDEKVMMESKGVAEAASSHLRVNMGQKVGKKRSRASRKAPTTVLSTDAWNFRAMVQHFTGFPQSSQPPLPVPASHLSFHNNPPPPQRYSSFLFHHDFNPSPLFLQRPAPPPPPLRQTTLMEDMGLNPAAASVVLSSDRRLRYDGYS